MEDTELVQTRREQRRRRRPPSSFQEERGSSLSREGNTSPTGHNSSDIKDARETAGDHSSPRKRRTRRRNSQEQGVVESERAVNGTHYQTRAARERPHQKRDSPPKRMPRSVSEEVLAMQGKFPPPPSEAEPTEVKRHRRSRRREQADQGHEHGHEDSGTVSGDYHSAEKTQHKPRTRQPPRKKKKTRKAFITSGEEDNYQGDVDGEVSEVFKVDKEDIVANDTTASPSKVPTLSAPTLPSQPLDYLFIEKKDGQGFVKEHKTKLARVEEENTDYAKEVMELHSAHTSIDLALQVHMAFRTFALFCHGLLAGLALVQCLFVYTLSNVSNTNFLNNYQVLAQPFQSMYYFLLVISTVSVFDRFVNVSAGCRQFFLGLLTYPSRALALLVYLIGLSFSLGLVQMDERISLYKGDPSLWASLKGVSTWKILNVFRVAGAIAGWFFVSLNPVDDLTAKHLTAIADLHTNEIISERSAVSYPV